jgi:hypothetical protein
MTNFNQDTVLNWFGMNTGGIDDPQGLSAMDGDNYGIVFNGLEIEPSPNVSLETLKLLVWGLLDKVQDGLTLADIEGAMFFIIFVRFVFLAIRYNLKTSFCITVIGLLASYLWYRHLIDLISMYRLILTKVPFLNKLGMDAIQLRFSARQAVITDLKLGENVHWYNPAKVVYYAFTKGILYIDPETRIRYYMDPISMIVSNLNEKDQSEVIALYYKIYNTIIPKIYGLCTKFWKDIAGLSAYAIITRIGKRYCPYLIRWHWTFLLILGLFEQPLQFLFMRTGYFLTHTLIPLRDENIALMGSIDPNVELQINVLNVLLVSIVLGHISIILFGLFHAVWGQYFYMPFFVENTELHVGPRPKTSIYSGGNTSWQDEKEENFNRVVPKFWYGWLGRGTKKGPKIATFLKKVIKGILRKLKKQFRK